MAIISSIICILIIIFLIHYFQIKHKKKVEKDFLNMEKELKSFASAGECLGYFDTPIPEGYVIFHKNGDKKDNRFNNLEIITRKEMLLKIGKKKNASC